jgi:hypothetical protein
MYATLFEEQQDDTRFLHAALGRGDCIVQSSCLRHSSIRISLHRNLETHRWKAVRAMHRKLHPAFQSVAAMVSAISTPRRYSKGLYSRAGFMFAAYRRSCTTTSSYIDSYGICSPYIIVQCTIHSTVPIAIWHDCTTQYRAVDHTVPYSRDNLTV